jgi:tRNA-dihydrouridine synthase 3
MDNNATITTVTTPALPAKERKLIDFRNKVYIAPLTTVGNLPFRRIMKSYGADITCGEMALADQLLAGKPSEWALLKRHPSEDVFGVQIAAGHADLYTRVAEILGKEEGGENNMAIDFLDMNLGCPLDMVCDKGAGASLMLRDKKLRSAIEGMAAVLNCPITIKMRTGWNDNQPFAHELVPKIQSWGIDGVGAIMIHGRSRLQRYSREANWEYIAKVARSQSAKLEQQIPVIGNGDVFSYLDYERILKLADEESGIDYNNGSSRNNLSPTAMLARGALIKPWLPTEIKERRHWDISATERLDMLKDFVKFGLEHWGSDQQGVNHTRRFLLEWMSFLYRYVPVGMLEVLPQQLNARPPNNMCGRSDLETLMFSKNCADWIKISCMLLGPVPEGFQFEPKHKANSYQTGRD